MKLAQHIHKMMRGQAQRKDVFLYEEQCCDYVNRNLTEMSHPLSYSFR